MQKVISYRKKIPKKSAEIIEYCMRHRIPFCSLQKSRWFVLLLTEIYTLLVLFVPFSVSGRKYLSVYGEYDKLGLFRTQNCIQICGKYLNIFGEYVERILAYMEKTQRASWRILLIGHEIHISVYISVNNNTNFKIS